MQPVTQRTLSLRKTMIERRERVNRIEIVSDSVVLMHLQHGLVASFNAWHLDRFRSFTWHATKSRHTHYLYTCFLEPGGHERNTSMHAMILGTTPGQIADHIDGNGLNNLDENLRIVSPRGNMQNLHCSMSSRFPGVSWNKRSQRWEARIKVGGVRRGLGRFFNEEDAALAYENECMRLGFGPVASTRRAS